MLTGQSVSQLLMASDRRAPIPMKTDDYNSPEKELHPDKYESNSLRDF
jgi:hypothetical protein